MGREARAARKALNRQASADREDRLRRLTDSDYDTRRWKAEQYGKLGFSAPDPQPEPAQRPSPYPEAINVKSQDLFHDRRGEGRRGRPS